MRKSSEQALYAGYANELMKRYLIRLTINNTRPLEWLKPRRPTAPSVDEDVKKLEISHMAEWNVIWHICFGAFYQFV